MGRVVVLGVGLTKVGEHWNKSIRDLFVEAALRAVEDAGIELSDIEAVIVGNMSSGYLQGQEHLGALMSTWLGLRGVATAKVESACASGGVAFHQAFLAVASGIYDCVLVGGVEKMTDAVTEDVISALIMADDQEYVASTGITFAGLNALVYREYMRKYGVKQEEIAYFAVHDHKYARDNPYAQYPFEVSLEQVLASPLVADPIRLLESSPISDGAAAVVLCSLEKAKSIKSEGLVEVVGSAVATDILSPHEREDLTTLYATHVAAERAYKMAKVEPKDINVVEVHDAYTVLGPIHLEDLGFVKKGDGAKFVVEGNIEKDGKLPTNTFGGLKARGHPVGATGIYQIVEVVWQLRGEAGKNQVSDAEIGLAQSVGGVGSSVAVNIFRRLR
ncbi:MAG: thiolase domain-containing protein [Thermoprotei archaeon]|nr:MAG: thiolase domain-containing protein [Thermoprotei archaeon]RLF03020.1 MAG: thiolase domain-containing protein [Thermoprotei archaeon]